MGIMYESGALLPESDAARAHAEKYYKSIRQQSNDILRICDNTGMAKEVVSAIKSHIFYTYHDLYAGFMRFHPSYEMAQSWQRLSGKDKRKIQPHDITMLRHEFCEMNYMMKYGSTYDEAHAYAQKKFDYASESNEYYEKFSEIFGK